MPTRPKPFKGVVIVLRGQIVSGVWDQDEANGVIRGIERRYRDVGLKPPPMATTVIHSREWFESWVNEDVHRQVIKQKEKDHD
jgi:hypothetical protein